MAYIPHTSEDRKVMLDTIGVGQIDDLYGAIPEGVRFPDLELPPPTSELELIDELEAFAEANAEAKHYAYFLGAGAYNHFIPSVVDHILRRNEFYTAYTPYQPEVSQGTLQAIFEYQSMVAFLTGMEVSNASHYDGATALAEAVILALNQHRMKRTKVIVSPSIHPHYREVLRTYMLGAGLEVTGDDHLSNGPDEMADLVDENTTLVAVQYPDFFGRITDFTTLSDKVHAAGALFCVVANPLSLGLLKPPSDFGADIVVGEGQPLGIPMSYGGPYLGIFTTKEKYVRKMSGRLVGETVDNRGQRGYVLTLTPREQHIRREKATSNICTNQGLMALASTVYLSMMGRQGLRQVAELCYQKAHYAAKEISRLEGYTLWNEGDFFHEFVISCPKPVDEINDHLLDYDIVGGLDLGAFYPQLDRHMLLAVTELNGRDQIDALVEALKEGSNG